MNDVDKQLAGLLDAGAEHARADGSATLEARHVLLALAGDPVTAPLLRTAGLDAAALRRALHREFAASLAAVGVAPAGGELPRPAAHTGSVGLGASTKLAMERGFAAATRKRDVTTAHVLFGILAADVGTVPRALALAGVDRAALLQRVRAAIGAGRAQR
jgi:D-alanyl-D-alanine carboxypeptidase